MRDRTLQMASAIEKEREREATFVRMPLRSLSPCPRSSLYVHVCPPEVEPFPIRLATMWFHHSSFTLHKDGPVLQSKERGLHAKRKL